MPNRVDIIKVYQKSDEYYDGWDRIWGKKPKDHDATGIVKVDIERLPTYKGIGDDSGVS